MKLRTDKIPARPLRWWDLACAAVLVFIVTVVVIDGVSGDPYWMATADTGWRVTLLTAPAVLFAVLYVALGRRVILGGMIDLTQSSRSQTYLVSILLLLAAGTFCDPMYSMLQALVYPMVWTIALEYREAVLWNFAVAMSVGAGMYLGLVTLNPEAALASSLITAGVSLVFAIAMGTWISRIHDEGNAYRELAEKLRRTQSEVAALSQAAGASAERERMSRDLHDTLTQTLAGLVMLSEQAERAIDSGDGARAQDRLARARPGRRRSDSATDRAG